MGFIKSGLHSKHPPFPLSLLFLFSSLSPLLLCALCVFVYVCVFICLCMFICFCVYVCFHVCLYACVYTCVCMLVCICVYICVCVCVCVCEYTWLYVATISQEMREIREKPSLRSFEPGLLCLMMTSGKSFQQ